MVELKHYSLVKPTLNTPFHIDFDWWQKNDREWRVHMISCLPAEYQQIIEEESAKIPPLHDELMIKVDEEYKQKNIDYGYEYITLPQSDLDTINATLGPVRENWVEKMEAMGLPGQKVLDDLLRLEQKYACP